MSIFDRTFWVQTAERSLKTVAQAAAALLVGNGVGLLDADWVSVLSVAGMAGVVSVLTSIGSGYVGDDSPSLVD
jgi:glyoxylate carboligase